MIESNKIQNNENIKFSPPRSRASSVGCSRAGSYVAANTKSPEFHKRSVEMQYNLKVKRLATMKRELLEKQKPAIELYKSLLGLRSKFKEIEGKELPLEHLNIVQYPEVKGLDEKEKELEEMKLKEMKNKINSTPTVFMDLCRQILDEKCGILDEIFDDEGVWNQDDLIRKIQHYKQESAMLEGKIESRLKEEEGKMKELIKEWFQITKVHVGECIEYNLNTDVELKLQETEHKLKQAIADLQSEKTKKNKELFEKNRELEREYGKMKDKFNELSKILEEERAKATCQKERQNVLEHKMKATKTKLKEADTIKQDLELQVDNLNEIIKKNEDEWKMRELCFETKHKDLLHTVKIHKEELDKLEQQRHAVDVRMQEMQLGFEKREKDYQHRIQQMEFEINELKSQKANIEKDYDILRVKTVNSEVYNHMHSMNQRMTNTYEDTAAKTATEMALWQELRDTKSNLKLAEEKLSIYADEKTRFLDTISENFEDDTPVNMTAQIMQKEELISTLILQNKQLQESLNNSQTDLNKQSLRVQELEEKIKGLNEQIFVADVDTEKEIYDLHAKLQYEIEHNKELGTQLSQATEDNRNIREMLIDYENLLKIRDGLLNMMQEKRQATEEQNNSLKDYIVQMRDQLNLVTTLSIDKSKKEQELKTLTVLLEEKTGYIDKIEERVVELENSVQELKNKRAFTMNLTPVDETLAIEQSPSRVNAQHFINHAQNLCTQEAIRFRKTLHSHLTLKNAKSSGDGPSSLDNDERPPSSHSSKDSEDRASKIVTTVSDIIKKYASKEGLDLKAFDSSFSINNN